MLNYFPSDNLEIISMIAPHWGVNQDVIHPQNHQHVVHEGVAESHRGNGPVGSHSLRPLPKSTSHPPPSLPSLPLLGPAQLSSPSLGPKSVIRPPRSPAGPATGRLPPSSDCSSPSPDWNPSATAPLISLLG